MADAVDDGGPSDARLIAEFRRGDARAGELLFRRHAGPLRRVAVGWAAQPAELDDLVAEAFTCVLAVLRAGGGPRENLRPYLVVTMRNLAARWSRHRFRTEPRAVVPENASAAGADDLVLRRSTDELVRSAFHTLPVRWRMVLWSTVAEGHTTAELAPVLGVSPNGVAALLSRAREGLRQAYLQAQQLPKTGERSCAESRPHLGSWLRGELPERRAELVAAHVAVCVTCRAAVDAIDRAPRRARRTGGVSGPGIERRPPSGAATRRNRR
ncbi:sigma-70 family RNA polymerase sigma factor [Amycolatopsis sp. NPDC004378]